MSLIIDAHKTAEVAISIAKQKSIDIEILNDQYKKQNKELKKALKQVEWDLEHLTDRETILQYVQEAIHGK